MQALVLVEGPTDRGVVEAIAEKLGLHPTVRIMRGDRPGKAVRLLKAYPDYAKAIVLKDLHRHDEHTVTRNLEEIARAVTQPKVIPIVVRRAIEAWILADPESLSRELGVRVDVGDPEKLLDPASVLDHYMKRAGRTYIKNYETAKKLASTIDLNRAAKRSQSLAAFVKALQDN